MVFGSKMEKKQGFFSSLKEEVVRGLSPARSRSNSPGRVHRKTNGSITNPESSVLRSGIPKPVGETLTPLIEGPDPDCGETGEARRVGSVGQWVRGQLNRNQSASTGAFSWNGYSNKNSDLRLLLGVMGAPLAPVHVSTTDHWPHLSIKDSPIETSSAKYILQQYTAATGGQKLLNSIKNAYAMGKLKMVASEFETAAKVVKNRNAARAAESGGFILWQMNPDMWYVELAVGGSKVYAGCNGNLVWRHTPWLGARPAKGPARPLRRSLQGLDPRTTARMFADAICIGEKKINREDCFILKLSADPQTLRARSEGLAEIIRHTLFGYFSQKTGFLVHMEDSHLTRIQSNGDEAVYYETTTSSFLYDYRPVEGIMIAHSGRSVVTLLQFGEAPMSHTKTRMEEAWAIEEVAFNIPGLSLDCFIPPADLRRASVGEDCGSSLDERERSKISLADHRAKVVAGNEIDDGGIDNLVWKMKI